MKTKLFMPIAIAALACGASAQNLDRKVSFEEPAGPADRVLADLSKSAGVKLTADSEMAREVLLIAVHDAPLKELLDRIAKVTSGRWMNDHGSLGLVPDRQARDSQVGVELKAKTEALRKLIKGSGTDQPRNGAADGAPPGRGDFQLGGGLHDLIGRLVNQIDLSVIAGLGADQRLVYSSNPTASQLPLPQLGADEVSAFITKHNTGVDDYEKELAKKPETEEQRQTKEFVESLGFGDEGNRRIPAQPTTILLAISHTTALGQFSMDLRFYDHDGKVTFHDSQQLFDPEGMIALSMSVMGLKKPETTVVKKGEPITFSPTSLELLSLLRGDTLSTGKLPKISDGVLIKLLHPEQYDPLSYIPTDALLGLAHNRHEQLVADLPDSTAVAFGMSGKGITDSEYLGRIESEAGGIVAAEASGWIQISPKQPVSTRTKRLDRDALGEFINASHSKGAPTLDDIARYALRAERPDFTGPETLYLSLFAPNSLMGAFLGNNDWNTVRFYGLMDATQKASLREGGVLPVQSLSSSQVELVRQMVYGAGTRLEVHRPGDKPKTPMNPFMEMAAPYIPQVQSDYLQEPTESLAGGLPQDSTLKVGFSGETVIKPVGKDASQANMFGVLGVTEYSMYRYFTEQPSFAASGQQAPKLDQMKIGKRATYTFTFRLSPIITMTKKLTDDEFASDAATVGVADLPKDFLDAVASRIADLKKLPPFFTQGMFGGAKPPP